MKTYFAPAEKSVGPELDKAINYISNNAIIDGIMRSVGGLFAVLNEQRQILAINDTLLQLMGIRDADAALGLRPGEALGCVYSHEMEGGCGTSRYCSTCGAVIAIVAALSINGPVEKKCVMTVNKGNTEQTLYMGVRASPLLLEGHRFVLLFMRDISAQEWNGAVERVFFHDINNILAGLVGTGFMMEHQPDIEGVRRMIKPLQQMIHRLAQEVKLQSALSHAESMEYQPEIMVVSLTQVVQEQKDIFSNHPVAKHKLLILPSNLPHAQLLTDPTLLSRILTNMLKNAFEATESGGEIKLSIAQDNGALRFSVWNKNVIPDDAVLRIFQRYFSTKNETGRGLGTYAMKLFGQNVLKGKVSFSTSPENGTYFHFELPCNTAGLN